MAVVVEREEWVLNPLTYVFLFACCFCSVFLLPHFSRCGAGAARATTTGSSLFDFGPTAPFLRFQRSFLLLYSLASGGGFAFIYFSFFFSFYILDDFCLARFIRIMLMCFYSLLHSVKYSFLGDIMNELTYAVMKGLESVYGEYEFAYHGMSREQMVLAISSGVVFSLILGTFLGILSDIIGPRKLCILFYFFHLLVGVLKSVCRHPSILLSSLCIGITSTVYSFCFETWMVNEHEKQGHRIDLLSDTFWLMTLFESSSLLGSQGLANLLIKDLHKGFLSPSAPAALLAIICILFIRKKWDYNHQKTTIESYQKSFTGHILADKSIWILGWAQASVHFSLSVFSILWAPTIVADGREVQLSHIYPCFLGSRMLGSTAFPWFSGTTSPLHNEDHSHLIAAFVIAGLVLSIVAYGYQDIGVLVVLFCIFHACIGLISPSLARLRTMYVPNELRGGMISASLVPANAAFLFVLVIGGYYRSFSNAVIMALAAVGLLSSVGCIYLLRCWRKHPNQSWHES